MRVTELRRLSQFCGLVANVKFTGLGHARQLLLPPLDGLRNHTRRQWARRRASRHHRHRQQRLPGLLHTSNHFLSEQPHEHWSAGLSKLPQPRSPRLFAYEHHQHWPPVLHRMQKPANSAFSHDTDANRNDGLRESSALDLCRLRVAHLPPYHPGQSIQHLAADGHRHIRA